MVDTLVNPCYNKDMKTAMLLTLLIAGTAQASEFDVCVANGVFYFTEVGAYEGKVTEDLISNRCKKTTQAYPSVKPGCISKSDQDRVRRQEKDPEVRKALEQAWKEQAVRCQ